MNRKMRRQTERQQRKAMSMDEARFRGLGLIHDRASNARTLAQQALTLLPEDAEEREFYEDAITDLEGVMLETTKALLEPVLERLRAAPEQSEAGRIVLP